MDAKPFNNVGWLGIAVALTSVLLPEGGASHLVRNTPEQARGWAM